MSEDATSHSYPVWFVGENADDAVKGEPFTSQPAAEGHADGKGGLPVWQSTMTVTFTPLVQVVGQREAADA